MKYLYSVAIFRLIYRDKKDVLKRFKIHREGEGNVNNKQKAATIPTATAYHFLI